MFRQRDAENYQGALSSGEFAPLKSIPTDQLAQNLCCVLSHLARTELAAIKFANAACRLSGLMHGEKSPLIPTSASRNPTELGDVIDISKFQVISEEGQAVAVSSLHREDLLAHTVRAFIACELLEASFGKLSYIDSDRDNWRSKRPAPTMGKSLKKSLRKSRGMPKISEVEKIQARENFTNLHSYAQLGVLKEIGLYEEFDPDLSTPSIRGTVLWNAWKDIEKMHIYPAIIDQMKQLPDSDYRGERLL